MPDGAVLDGRRSVNQVSTGGSPWRSAVRQRLGLVTLVVNDYDEAISYFIQKLGFALVQDTPIDRGKRWVVVAPQGAGGSALLLAKATNERQRQAVGSQAGGRVFCSFTRMTSSATMPHSRNGVLLSSTSRGWSHTEASPSSRTSMAIAGT
jgi:Glyoxalase/Bleomycin resistance protein/Dioxygenase superfamily